MSLVNCITLSRIVLIIPVLLLVSFQENIYNWIALVMFIIAGLTDHLDGVIARRTGTTSQLGALLDLVADKLLICLPMIFFISYFDNKDLILPSMIIISRELIVMAFRQFLTEIEGYNPVEVSIVAKSKTTIQITSLSFLIVSSNFGEYFYLFTLLLFWLSAFISLYSLYGYITNYKNLIK